MGAAEGGSWSINAPTNPSLRAAWDGSAFETYGLCYWDEEAQRS